MEGNASLNPEHVTDAYQSKVCWPLLMATFLIIYLIYINLHHEIMGRKSTPYIPITFPLWKSLSCLPDPPSCKTRVLLLNLVHWESHNSIHFWGVSFVENLYIHLPYQCPSSGHEEMRYRQILEKFKKQTVSLIVHIRLSSGTHWISSSAFLISQSQEPKVQ